MNPALPANERGKWSSLVLAAAVHAALGLFLFYGVRWQNRLPDPIEVELVSAPPPAALVAPPPAPPVEARPKPPAPAPGPEDEDEPEPPPRKQPDIAIKAPEPKRTPPKPVKEVAKPLEKPVVKPKLEPKPKPEPKPAPKPQLKPEPKAKPEPAKVEKPAEKPVKPVDISTKTDKNAKANTEKVRELEDRRMRELMARDSENVSQSKQLQSELARVANAKETAARIKAQEAYIAKIRQKVLGNLVTPPGINGSPSALFYVNQLPDGTILDIRLKRTTGNAVLDEAIERAFRKSSPLPKPDRADLFQREMQITFTVNDRD
jgi:colicin import membrane protein